MTTKLPRVQRVLSLPRAIEEEPGFAVGAAAWSGFAPAIAFSLLVLILLALPRGRKDAVRQYYHLDSVVLLGHSWGTVLALEYALRYPERVSHLILMNPGPASTDDYKQLRKEWLEKRANDMERRKAMSATAAYKEGDPDAVTAYYRIHFKPALARPEDYEKIIARLRASFTKDGILKARAIEARLMSETWSSPEYNLLPKLKSLRIPTLVISGDHEFIPAATAEHITQAMPNARMVTLKGCGHFSYLESPVAVREQIDAFFGGTTRPARLQ